MNSYLERTDSFVASLGLEAYRVGGSVRDEILGRRVKDADYIVRDTLNEVARRFHAKKHTVENAKLVPLSLRDGRQAGWRVSGRGLGCIEIVLPRKEVSTGPGHGDFEIVVDPSLTLDEDAKRRDFTFNALYKPVPQLDRALPIDPTGRGLRDLQRRTINVTHATSFRDDPVRMLRALRFVSTLGYDVGGETGVLMQQDAEAARNLVGPKGGASAAAFEELCKLLMGPNVAKALRYAVAARVLENFLPELEPMLGFDQGSRYHDMTTDEHTFVALETAAHVEAPLRVRLALLFHDSGKPETAWTGPDGRKHYYAKHFDDPFAPYTTEDHEIAGARLWRKAAKRLGAGKALIHDVDVLIRNHMVSCEKVKPTKVRRERVRLGDDMLRDLYLMRSCDLSGKGNKNMKFIQNIALMEKERLDACEAGVPAALSDLKINGDDAIDAGLEGSAIGAALARVLDEVVVQPDALRLSREWQLGRLVA